MRSRILAFALLFVGPSEAMAAGNEGGPGRSLRFSVFSASAIAGLTYIPRADAPEKMLDFYPTARSPRYEYSGAGPLRFYQAGFTGPVAEINLPPGLADALFLFSAVDGAAAGNARYRVQAIDDSGARRASGTLAIINASGLVLGGIVGKNFVTLGEGLNPPFAAASSTRVELRTAFKGKNFPAYTQTLALGPGERALLILFPPFRPGSLEVQSRLLVDEPPVPRPNEVKSPG